MKTWLTLLIILCFVPGVITQAQSKKPPNKTHPLPAVKDTVTTAPKLLVTFVELGSVKCIPCKAMQPVMKSIERKYAEQIKVVFYDVWKEEQKKFADQYGIKLIPTQVFLDKNGKEFFRHEGFYPEEEIDKLLQKQGLKTRTGG
jgi:thioredoxin 1